MSLTGFPAPIGATPPGPLGQRALFRARPAGITQGAKKEKRAFLPFLVQPFGLTQEQWAAALVYAMAPVLPLPQPGASFEAWAAQVMQEPQLQTFLLPPASADWQTWAAQLSGALGPMAAY